MCERLILKGVDLVHQECRNLAYEHMWLFAFKRLGFTLGAAKRYLKAPRNQYPPVDGDFDAFPRSHTRVEFLIHFFEVIVHVPIIRARVTVSRAHFPEISLKLGTLALEAVSYEKALLFP